MMVDAGDVGSDDRGWIMSAVVTNECYGISLLGTNAMYSGHHPPWASSTILSE